MRTNKNIKTKKTVFSFVVDGKDEIWYLQMMKKNEKLLNVNIEPKLPQKKILSEQYKMVTELAKESEKVFWIIDFDNINKETRETKKGNKTPLQELKEFYDKTSDNTIIIMNNPCLEFWFLLHYWQTLKYFATYADIKKELEKHLPDYEKTEKYFKNSRQDIYQHLKPNLATAINNAILTGSFDFKNTHKGLSEMHIVFNKLGLN